MDLNRLNELKSEDVVLGKWDKFIPIVSTKESLINVIKTVVSQKESISNLKNEFNLEMRDLKQSISSSMDSTKEYGDPFYNSIHASYFGEKDKYKCDNVSKELTEAIKYSQAKGYLTVYNSPMEREQPDEIRKYAQTIAYIRAHEDPIIGAIPDSLMRFVLGRGVKYKCPDYRIQTIIDKFWNMNNMEIFNKQALWLLIVESEFFPLYFLNSKNGDVYIREVQPSEIDIVETHKEDRRTILSYKRTFFQKDYNKKQIDGIDRYYPDINYYVRKEEGVLGGVSEFEGKEGWRGETELMQFVKLMWNREVRGRVYLERVMKWAEWYKNWIIDRAIINHEKGRVVWILEISGRTNEVWERFLPAPAGGLTRISTPDRKWNPVNATIKAEDAKEDGLFLLYQVAAGTGIPIHVLTQRTSESVYASIRTADTPFSQLILDIQDTLMESYLKPMMRVVIRAAVKYGKLPSKVKIRKYVNEELRNIFRVNYDAYVNKELSDTLMVRQTKDLIEAYVGNISDNKGLNNTIKYEILESCFQVIESLNDASTRLIEGKDIEKSSKDFIKKASNMFETGFLITIDSEDVPVEITFPDMIRENLDETAKVIKIHRELGIVSKTTASAKAGYSPEQERYLLKTEDFESKEEIKAKAEEKANAKAEQEKNNDGGNNPQGGGSTAGGTGTKPNAGGTKKDSK